MYDINNLETNIQEFSNFTLEKGGDPLKLAANLMVQAFLIYAANMSKKEYKALMKEIFSKSATFTESRVLH